MTRLVPIYYQASFDKISRKIENRFCFQILKFVPNYFLLLSACGSVQPWTCKAVSLFPPNILSTFYTFIFGKKKSYTNVSLQCSSGLTFKKKTFLESGWRLKPYTVQSQPVFSPNVGNFRLRDLFSLWNFWNTNRRKSEKINIFYDQAERKRTNFSPNK